MTDPIARNHFLTLALIALPLRYGLPLATGGFTEGVVGLLWTSAAFALTPFSLVATWLDPYLRGFPEFVDLAGTLGLGLLPYAAADVVHRRLVLRRLVHQD
jgi:hypothetical protein